MHHVRSDGIMSAEKLDFSQAVPVESVGLATASFVRMKIFLKTLSVQ